MNKANKATWWSVALMATIVAGCGESGRVGRTEVGVNWEPIDEAVITIAQEAQRQKANAARTAAFQSLMSRLQEVKGSKGAVAAIEVCSKEAREITRQIGVEHGVEIGRTSHKLRNPENVPPAWASSLVDSETGQSRFLNGPNGKLGALFPIRLKKECLVCHGPSDEIPSNIQTEISRVYPKDKATGFEEGDLRGWFWVVVPPEVEEVDVDSPL